MHTNKTEHRDATAEATRRLRTALTAFSERPQQIGEADRAVADYCRRRHEEGAEPELVIIELKTLARPILGENNPDFDRIISACIRHFYGEPVSKGD